MVDGAIRLYRTHFVTLITISAAILGPIGLIELIAAAALGPLDLESLMVVEADASLSEVFAPLVPLYTVFGLTGLLSFFGSVIVQGASITALTQAYQGLEPDAQTSLRAGVRRFLPLTGATVLVGIGAASPLIASLLLTMLAVMAAGTVGLLAIVPLGFLGLLGTVFLVTRWTVAPAAVIAEQRGPLQSMGRSFRLVRGRFWPVLGAVVLAYLLYFVVSQVIGTVISMLSFADVLGGESISLVPSVIGSILVSIVSAPFVAAMITIIYFDLRVRKEGYDLELMARDLEAMEGRRPTLPASEDDTFGLGDPGNP